MEVAIDMPPEPLPPGVEQADIAAPQQQQQQQPIGVQQQIPQGMEQVPPQVQQGVEPALPQQQWYPWQPYPPYPPPPPQFQSPPTHQIKLTSFWSKDVVSWFTLAESTFNRYKVDNSRLRFDLVLQALPEEVLERIRAVLHAAPAAADPYADLKKRLVEIFTPSVLDLAHRIMYAPELGGKRPSELMEMMLAALPPGELPGILFKAHFLARLPTDFRDLVAIHVATYEPMQLAILADQLWMARNARPGVAAAVTAARDDGEDGDGLADAVAALQMGKKDRRRNNKKSKPSSGGGGSGGYNSSGGSGHGGGGQAGSATPYHCRAHHRYGGQAYNCLDPKFCKWSEN